MKNKIAFCLLLFVSRISFSQDMEKGWDKGTTSKENPNIQWFKDAKFGMFVHWGLYSKLGGIWKGKNYYGSGEWIMNVAKIPAAEYSKEAQDMDLTNFDADEWIKVVKESGMKYLVVTAKHHEGFAMFDSKVSDFTIVKATKYGKDPMRPLSEAAHKAGIQFGFYYSQFLDWHEPNGGGNKWDFDETKKDYQKYYREKAIPQLKELLTNYGPLGIVWFDMPGGLTREQTKTLVDSLHMLQPKCLFSSRVGQGLGDYRDFGDSEIPAKPIMGAWESIYTHNDSWGYIYHDMNFKSPKEIIRLLASVASKGGNLMLNVGPDGTGKLPEYSVKYLLEIGKWLHKFGQSIYGTTYGFIPAQPWGVTTSKPGKLFLHIFELPKNGKLLVPNFENSVTKVYQLNNKKIIKWSKAGTDLYLDLPVLSDKRNTVIVVEYKGEFFDQHVNAPLIVSSQYSNNFLDAANAKVEGGAKIKSITHSDYFGDWKHTTCITNMMRPQDQAIFNIRITDAGDYKIVLEYNCTKDNSRQEGIVTFDNRDYSFQTLRTSADYTNKEPMIFFKHPVADVTVSKPDTYTLKIHPMLQGKDLFNLKSIILEPVE